MFGRNKKDDAPGAAEGDLLTELTLLDAEEEDIFFDEEDPEPDAGAARKRRRRAGAVVFGVVLLGLAAFLFFTLRIETIEVRGNQRFSEAEILAAAGIRPGAHMWMENLSAVEDALLLDPYIATARIVRIYPSTVRINITERREAAAILSVSGVVIVDKAGYVLSIGEDAEYEGLLKIYGAGASGYRVNGQLGDASDFTSRTMVALMEAIAESGVESQVESVDITNALSVTMQTKAGYTVQLGQPEALADKLRKFAIVLPEVERLGYTAGTIDVSVRGDPVFSPPGAPEEVFTEDYDPTANEYTAIPSEQDRPADSSGDMSE